MTPRTWALAAGTAGGALAMWARPLSTPRVYQSLRHESEFDSLLTLGGTLVSNFCILTDPNSIKVSNEVKKLAPSLGLRCVDVELDEPGIAQLGQRYAVSRVPTLIAFRGGMEVDRWIHQRQETTLDAWLQSLCET